MLKNRNNLGFKECVIYIDFQIIYWKTVRNVKKETLLQRDCFRL